MAAVARLWQRIPVIVRAGIVGTVICSVGEVVPANLFFANRRLWPAVPWFVPLAVLWLWVFWRYVRRWWDVGATPLPPRVWRWALIAGGSMMGSLMALHFVAARFDPIDYRGFYALFEELPPQTLVMVVLVISAAAGMVEEAAYRGTMQRMIERRHGRVVATVVVAFFFCAVHITAIPPLTVTRTLFIFAASVGYSVLVYATGSILPGVVLHFVGDAAGVFILWWLWSLGGSGSNWPLWPYIAESAILATISVWAFRKLRRHE